MAPPRLVFILLSVLALTFLLTFFSLVQSHPRHYATSRSSPTPDQTNFRSLFSFRTPSALFPSSAIISLTDDNSTFFLARPADFGPSLPADGLSGQLWVGSGFGDDNLGRGLATDTEGELGCSDVPGWRHGRKYRQGDGQFEPSTPRDPVKFGGSASGHAQGGESQASVQDASRHREDKPPSDHDGTDDHLHHPLPASQVGRTAELQHHPTGQQAQHADIQSLQESAEISGKLVMLSRGGCGFLEKVKWVQRRGGAGLIVGDNTRGGALVTMYAKGDTSNVTIPALFTSRTTAHLLSSLIPPELPNNNEGLSEERSPETLSARPIDDALAAQRGDDRSTFTPTALSTEPTPSIPTEGFTRRSKERPTRRAQKQSKDNRGWLRLLFGRNSETKTDSIEYGATADSRRPPSSGRLTWINEQWTESAIKPGDDKRKLAYRDNPGSQAKPSELDRSGAHANSGDEFEIGVHDWRDPDLVGVKATQSSISSPSSTSTRYLTATALNGDGNGHDKSRTLSGGSITPGSGEYQKPAVAMNSGHKTSAEFSALRYDGISERQGWLGRLFGGKAAGEHDRSSEMALRSRHRMGPNSKRTSDHIAKPEDHEGLWVTLTPTTMSTSPFFDTLLVLVFVHNIIVTTELFHDVISDFATASALLSISYVSVSTKVSHSVRHRRRHKVTNNVSMKQKDTTSKLDANKRQYHGKQIECVVCLEEYVDGQIRSMAKAPNEVSSPTVGPGAAHATDGDDVQVQAAETTNESPTAAIPIPRDLNDLERGDDMAATLVNDGPEASSARRAWRGLASFSCPRYQASSKRPPMQTPYSHIRVVPKVEPSVRSENVSPQATFRKASYSEEAASSIESTSRPLQPRPAASLANMTLGTTFAAKARAAELNAVRNSKAAAKENGETGNATPMASASFGALKLVKPRTRGKGWKTLDLDEIPEPISEVDRPKSHHAATIRPGTPSIANQNLRSDTIGAPNSPQVLCPPGQHFHPSTTVPAHQLPYYASGVQQANAVPRFVNEMATQNALVHSEQFRFQLALQNGRHVDPSAPALPTVFQAPAQSSPRSSTQQPRVTEDDPFIETQAGPGQPHHQKPWSHPPIEATTPSSHGAQVLQSTAQGTMDHEFKFPAEQSQRRNLPHPPGLPRQSACINSSPGNQEPITGRQPAPTADTHQRDPKPYTSYMRSSDDSSRKDKATEPLQLGVDVSKSLGNVAPSTRTVLYDPVAQGSSSSTRPPHGNVSQSGEDFLKASEPLPWKNRPVDIYNMAPSASMTPRSRGGKEASATFADHGGFDGNAYIRSLIAERESAEQRLRNTEAWWNHDGRGQQQVRAYLEQVANEHHRQKVGGEYDNFKKAMERQASFRDDWSDDSNATTVPHHPPAGEVINRLMVPVIANLRSYVDESGPSYFNKFSKTPAWAVDGSADGNRSFFGEEWGKPPPRVGRDPRYRPTFHEGRYTVFEPTDGRVSGRGW
ncbi:MAG: hypothetical protein Q9211_003493 [Gyalolechia sp. 1 TL-2023]